MVRAPSNLTIILMTGNLEAYYTDRKEYRKNIWEIWQKLIGIFRR